MLPCPDIALHMVSFARYHLHLHTGYIYSSRPWYYQRCDAKCIVTEWQSMIICLRAHVIMQQLIYASPCNLSPHEQIILDCWCQRLSAQVSVYTSVNVYIYIYIYIFSIRSILCCCPCSDALVLCRVHPRPCFSVCTCQVPVPATLSAKTATPPRHRRCSLVVFPSFAPGEDSRAL